jgi:hypothetical protein
MLDSRPSPPPFPQWSGKELDKAFGEGLDKQFQQGLDKGFGSGLSNGSRKDLGEGLGRGLSQGSGEDSRQKVRTPNAAVPTCAEARHGQGTASRRHPQLAVCVLRPARFLRRNSNSDPEGIGGVDDFGLRGSCFAPAAGAPQVAAGRGKARGAGVCLPRKKQGPG